MASSNPRKSSITSAKTLSLPVKVNTTGGKVTGRRPGRTATVGKTVGKAKK